METPAQLHRLQNNLALRLETADREDHDLGLEGLHSDSIWNVADLAGY